METCSESYRGGGGGGGGGTGMSPHPQHLDLYLLNSFQINVVLNVVNFYAKNFDKVNFFFFLNLDPRRDFS